MRAGLRILRTFIWQTCGNQVWVFYVPNSSNRFFLVEKLPYLALTHLINSTFAAENDAVFGNVYSDFHFFQLVWPGHCKTRFQLEITHKTQIWLPPMGHIFRASNFVWRFSFARSCRPFLAIEMIEMGLLRRNHVQYSIIVQQHR